MAFILVLTDQATAQQYFKGCDKVLNLTVGQPQVLKSENYPQYGWYPGSSCRYIVNAPGEYQINVKCDLYAVGDVSLILFFFIFLLIKHFTIAQLLR